MNLPHAADADLSVDVEIGTVSDFQLGLSFDDALSTSESVNGGTAAAFAQAFIGIAPVAYASPLPTQLFDGVIFHDSLS